MFDRTSREDRQNLTADSSVARRQVITMPIGHDLGCSVRQRHQNGAYRLVENNG